LFYRIRRNTARALKWCEEVRNRSEARNKYLEGGRAWGEMRKTKQAK
jgi:hypothetical protein